MKYPKIREIIALDLVEAARERAAKLRRDIDEADAVEFADDDVSPPAKWHDHFVETTQARVAALEEWADAMEDTHSAR